MVSQFGVSILLENLDHLMRQLEAAEKEIEALRQENKELRQENNRLTQPPAANSSQCSTIGLRRCPKPVTLTVSEPPIS